MSNFEVSTDSTCDLYADEIKNLGIYFVPLTFTLTKGNSLEECLDQFKSPEEYLEYYTKLRSGIVSKTSMLNYASHLEHFTNMAKQGVKNAIHFTISYGLSPTVDVANKALEEVKQTYPDFNCMCVECNTTTIGQGLLVRIATDMRDKGKTLQETYDYVNANKSKIQHFIVADSLMYLMRGGRVSGAKAVFGTLLNIKPIIIFTKNGKLENFAKGKGSKGALKSIVEQASNYTVNKDYPTVWVGHTDNLPMAQMLASELHEKYNYETNIRMIGPVIGSHLGPGAFAYCFLSNEERPI